MLCPNCGFESQPGMRFCGQCGARLGHVCLVCGFVNPLGYHFCGMCGTRLGPETVAGHVLQLPLPLSAERASEAAAIATADIVPASPVVGENGAAVAAPLAGERRVASVLVADVWHSTNLMEQLGTEAWVQMMNRVFQILEAEIYRLGGRVDQFRGDGLVAFFGAVSAHEDDPERAVLAGLAMQHSLQCYADELAEREIVLSMESAAEPGTVLVSEHTYQLVEAEFEWRPLGEMAVKGLSKPISAYRPLSARADLRWSDDMPVVPMMGRDREFQTLVKCVDDVYGGRGGVVLVTGDKGMGKSLLVTQVYRYFARREAVLAEACQDPAQSAACQPLTWLYAACRSYDQATPYSMWLDVLRNWLGAQPEEVCCDLATNLRHQAERLWGQEADQHYPYLAALLSLPLDEPWATRFQYLNAGELQKHAIQAVCSWVEARARRGPLVLAFGDAQWADVSSLEVLRRCLPLCDSQPVLWVVILRPDRASPVWEVCHHIETEYPHRLMAIDLGPLSQAECRALIDQLLGHAAMPDELLTLVLDKAEGNPYYVRELVQALIAQQTLVRDPATGGWRQTRPVTAYSLPSSLQGVLLARIDRLAPEERRVLQLAAVIGPVFWRNVLHGLVDDADQLKVLTSLQRAQLIQERTLVPDLGTEYAFGSSLLRDVTYESLLNSQRAALHLRVAERLEEVIGPEFRKPYHGLLAYHYHQAGNRNRELYYALGAAEEARKLHANAEALGHYTRALEALGEMEAEARDEAQCQSIRALRFEALSGRREVQYMIGNIEAGEADSRALLPLAHDMADDPAWMIDALLAQPEVTNPPGRAQVQAGLGMAVQTLTLARQLGDRRREMNAWVAIAQLRLVLQDLAWKAAADRALDLARQLADIRMEVNLLLGMGDAYGMDDLTRSKEYLDAAMSLSHQLKDKETEITLLGALSPQFERAGDYYRQLTEYEQKRLSLSREIGNRMVEGHALMFCGQIQAIYLGDYAGGLDLLQEALRNWDESSGKLFPLLRIAQVQVALGQFDQARETLEQARAASDRVVLGIGHVGLGLVTEILYNALGDEAHVRCGFERAAQAEQMVADNLVSRQYQMAAACESAAAHLGLARCLADEAERELHARQALECSQTALAIYGQFGFTQVVECVYEEILYRHGLALAANGRAAEADEYLARAYQEMMRKHDLIPVGQPFGHRPYRNLFLDNIALHHEIVQAFGSRP